MKNNEILISEIFGPTIQGEGALVGCPTVFVRTGGCDSRCTWCDSLHAVLPVHKPTWRRMCAESILTEVSKLTDGFSTLITLSGGNPAIMPLEPLLDLGHTFGHTFALETQATIARPWFAKLDHLILSPKPPSSGMGYSPLKLKACMFAAFGSARLSPAPGRACPAISVKVVVMDEADYEFARLVSCEVPDGIPFFITPGNHTPPGNPASLSADDQIDVAGIMARTRWILARLTADHWYRPRVVPQLHTLIWGNAQGV